eukprot:5135681-Ditylum_brightwellii.AAC.1
MLVWHRPSHDIFYNNTILTAVTKAGEIKAMISLQRKSRDRSGEKRHYCSYSPQDIRLTAYIGCYV